MDTETIKNILKTIIVIIALCALVSLYFTMIYWISREGTKINVEKDKREYIKYQRDSLVLEVLKKQIK